MTCIAVDPKIIWSTDSICNLLCPNLHAVFNLFAKPSVNDRGYQEISVSMLNYNVKGNKKERIKYNDLKNIWLKLYREEQFWLTIYLKCLYHVNFPQSGNS